MTDAAAIRKAEYEAFQKRTAEELMALLTKAEGVAKYDPIFSKYAMDLYRLRNSLSLDMQKLNER